MSDSRRIHWWTTRVRRASKSWTSFPVILLRRHGGFAYVQGLVGKYKGQEFSIVDDELSEWPPIRAAVALGAKKYLAEHHAREFARRNGGKAHVSMGAFHTKMTPKTANDPAMHKYSHHRTRKLRKLAVLKSERGKFQLNTLRKLEKENYNVVDKRSDRVVGHVLAGWLGAAQRIAEAKFGKGVMAYYGKKEPLGEPHWSYGPGRKPPVWNDPSGRKTGRDPSDERAIRRSIRRNEEKLNEDLPLDEFEKLVERLISLFSEVDDTRGVIHYKALLKKVHATRATQEKRKRRRTHRGRIARPRLFVRPVQRVVLLSPGSRAANDPDAGRDPQRPRRLPGPKPKMTYAIFHPATGEKKVYHGLKNKDACHRQAVRWAKQFRKNVRLTVLSSNAKGARPFKVTAAGKWLTKQIPAHKRKAAKKSPKRKAAKKSPKRKAAKKRH